MESLAISVTQAVELINETLEFAYPQLVVEGEVSGFKVSQNKWVFFDLKDESANVNCFLPLYYMKVPLEDGMKVRVTAQPKLTAWGKFSLTVKSVELAGEGELRRAFELLRAKLEKEGLFASQRKRQLPRFPQTIGLITSASSAAYQDFLKILKARWGGIAVSLADIQVQGTAAPDQIVAAINYFNQLAVPTDVLVLIRGGGSLEDLMAFNTEPVARAVAASRTPIVAGVGHEVDVSLADLAADVRAATPTDAARLVVPERSEVSAALNHQTHKLAVAVEKLTIEPARSLERFLGAGLRLVHAPRQRLAVYEAALNRELTRVLQDGQNRLQLQSRMLGGFDPAATLARGYAIVRREGKVLKQASTAKSGDALMIQLADGNLDATVKP